jgi:hypothetical protein
MYFEPKCKTRVLKGWWYFKFEAFICGYRDRCEYWGSLTKLPKLRRIGLLGLGLSKRSQGGQKPQPHRLSLMDLRLWRVCLLLVR